MSRPRVRGRLAGSGSASAAEGSLPSPFRARWRGAGAAVLLGSLLLLGACIPEEREHEIGASMAADVNPHLPLIDDPLLVGYLYTIGTQLVRVSSRPELDYHFYIVDTDAVNAFALPGGHIYLTRGLIERTRGGAEFAGVLAHEIAHVSARHGVQRLQRQLRTGSLVNFLYNTILGGEPALLRENSLQLASDLWAASYSRRDEKEADRLAVKYLLRAGIDPRGVVTLLQTLLEEEAREGIHSERFEVWFSTHPLTQNRIRDARRHISRLEDSTPPVQEVDLDAFESFQLLVSHEGEQPPL